MDEGYESASLTCFFRFCNLSSPANIRLSKCRALRGVISVRGKNEMMTETDEEDGQGGKWFGWNGL